MCLPCHSTRIASHSERSRGCNAAPKFWPQGEAFNPRDGTERNASGSFDPKAFGAQDDYFSLLLSRVTPDELALRDDMTFHRRIDLAPLRTGS